MAWSGVSDLGVTAATMTRNQPGTPDRSTFFNVTSEMQPARHVAAWVGANLSQTIGIEGGFHYGHPGIRARITGDVEGVEAITATAKPISQSLIEANLLLYANAARFDQEKTVPFLLIGGGYLRQEDAQHTIDEKGRIYQVGLGFKWVAGVARSGRSWGPGMRLDVRYVVRDGGLDFRDNVRRSFLTAGATALVAF